MMRTTSTPKRMRIDATRLFAGVQMTASPPPTATGRLPLSGARGGGQASIETTESTVKIGNTENTGRKGAEKVETENRERLLASRGRALGRNRALRVSERTAATAHAVFKFSMG
jgi:hypothetical protein